MTSLLKKFDFSTLIGISTCLILVFLSIIYNGSSISSFIDLPSIMIVVLGTLLSTTACFSFKDIIESHVIIFKMIFFPEEDPKNAAIKAIKLAEHARKAGIADLESHVKDKNQFSDFVRKGVRMVVDGDHPDKIERLFLQQISASSEQHIKVISILRKSAEIAPAMGLIGTLIGLVQMLGNMSDASKIGSSMALALLTTLYGAMLAYTIFFPLASKLDRNSKEHSLISMIYLQSFISIAKKENPRLLEMEINSILSPIKAIQYFKDL